MGQRAWAQSVNATVVGRGAVVQTTASDSTSIGNGATVNANSDLSTALGGSAIINANCSKSTIVGTLSSAAAPESTCLGYTAQSSAETGLALGVGAIAQPFAAAPSNNCPLALGINASAVVASGVAPAVQSGFLYININGVRYRIQLWQNL